MTSHDIPRSITLRPRPKTQKPPSVLGVLMLSVTVNLMALLLVWEILR